LLLTEALHRSDRFLRRSAAKLVRRNSVFAAHLLVTEAMNFLMQATFLLNGRFPPHTKWIEHDFNSLSWKPADGQRRFRSALRIRAFSPRELQRRVDEGLRLLEELFRRAKEQGGVMENYYQLLCTRHHKDRQFLSAPLAQRAARDARARGMEMEPALLRGVVNTALCADYSELAVWLADLGEPCLAPLQALVAGEGPHPEGDKP
jgi:hypothetical protein